MSKPSSHIHFAWLRVVGLVGLLALAAIGWNTGCGVSSDSSTDESLGQSEQAVTGCEVDCSNGSKLLCSVTPCTVVNTTTLNCNGTISTCPPPSTCVPKTCDQLNAECGSVSDGCGHNLVCGSCETGELCKNHICTCKPGFC